MIKFLFLILSLNPAYAKDPDYYLRWLDAEQSLQACQLKLNAQLDSKLKSPMSDILVTEFTHFTTPSGDECRTHMIGKNTFISCQRK